MSHSSAFIATALYIFFLVCIGFGSRRKHQTAADFILGSRKMNFWITALSAHASDMSSWIFMGYPAVVYSLGIFQGWTAIGLTLFMFLNWHFVAPRLRRMTESYNSLTLSSFFESRYRDTSGMLRITTVIVSFIYFTIYISAGLVGLGILMETLFGATYFVGICAGLLIIIPYLFIGGYVTLAWTDLFQGIFLMLVIVLVPLYALSSMNGWSPPSLGAMLPNLSGTTLVSIFFLTTSWGLGYFGQPHILTKFMGIQNVNDMPKSKWVGISWQIVSLSAATLVGLVGIAFFAQKGLANPELVFIDMVTSLFPPFIGSFILCAILGTTITSMDSQILVLASNLTEDFYKKLLRKDASSRELLIVSRLSILIVSLIAFVIAYNTTNSIFSLVSYAWFGLGASFGPLVIFGLYWKKANRYGAWAGLIIGSITAGVWPLINNYLSTNIPTLIPGFLISSFTIWIISYITQYKTDKGIIGNNNET